MKRLTRYLTFAILLAASAACSGLDESIPVPPRMVSGQEEGPVIPQGAIDTLFYIKYNQIGDSDHRNDYLTATASMQGLLNTLPYGNSIYVKYSSGYVWKDDLGAAVVLDAGKDYRMVFRRAMAELKEKAAVSGYVRMASLTGDTEVDNVNANIAACYAASFGAVILTDHVLEQERDIFGGLSMVYDAAGKTYDDVYDFLMEDKSRFALDGIVSGGGRNGVNIDIAIRHRWISLRTDEDHDSNAVETTKKFFAQIEPCSPRFTFEGPYTGEGREGKNIKLSSSYDLYCLPGGCTNLSTHERGPVFSNDKAVNARVFPTEDYNAPKHSVAIILSDGDNLAYFEEGKFMKFYRDPLYGTFPLSITMSGSLKRYRPAVHNWFYTHTHALCSIGCSLTGLGYIFPASMSAEGKRKYGAMTAEEMNGEGQRILAIMDRFLDETWNINTTTWQKVVDSSRPIIEQLKDCDGVIYFNHGQYDNVFDNMRARCTWIGDIPFVGARFECSFVKSGQTKTLDGGSVVDLYYPMDYNSGKKHSLQECAEMIANCSQDPSNPDAYSLVMVNVNSTGHYMTDGTVSPDTMGDVAILVNRLQAIPGVELVNINTFFDRYNKCVDRNK